MPPTRPQVHRQRPHASAFTSLELLVVIAIIGMLAALLLPSLNAAQVYDGIQRSGFSAAGTLHVESFRADGTLFREQSYGFKVDAGGSGWQVRADFGPNHYQVLGCDGTNVYSFLVDQYAENQKTTSGQLTEGTYPSVATWHISVPWLAYASSQRFSHAGGGDVILPAPWIVAAHDSAAHFYRARYSDLPPSFGVPRQIEFVVDHSLIDGAITNVVPTIPELSKAMSHPAEVLKALLPHGRVSARYEVLGTTNFMGKEIPVEFRMEVFRASEAVQLRFRGAATNVGESALLDYVPSPPMDVGVADFRYQDTNAGVTCIKYVVQNSRWPRDRNSPELLELFQRAKGHQKIVLEGHRLFLFQARALFWGVLALALTLPLVRWAKRQFQLRG